MGLLVVGVGLGKTTLGTELGCSDAADGMLVGLLVGKEVGIALGTTLGTKLGESEGTNEGISDISATGFVFGALTGLPVVGVGRGITEGEELGSEIG
jgi:hypothetical protein